MAFYQIIVDMIKLNIKSLFYNKKLVKQSLVQGRDRISGFRCQSLISSASIVIEA